MHMERTHARLEEVMFIDDSAENCRAVMNAIPGLRVHNCNTATGLTNRDCQLILAFFSKLSQTRGLVGDVTCRKALQIHLEARHCTAKPEDRGPGGSPVPSPRATTFCRVMSSDGKALTAQAPSLASVGRRSFASSVTASSPRARMLSAPNPRRTLGNADSSRFSQDLSASVRCLPKARTSLAAHRSLSPGQGHGLLGVPKTVMSSVQHASLHSRKDAKASSLPNESRSFAHIHSPLCIPTSGPPAQGQCTKMSQSPPPSARSKRPGAHRQRLGGA